LRQISSVSNISFSFGEDWQLSGTTMIRRNFQRLLTKASSQIYNNSNLILKGELLMKAKRCFAAVMMCAILCFAAGCTNAEFKDYDNMTVLGNENRNIGSYQQLIFSASESSDTLLSVKKLHLSGIEKIMRAAASEDVKASLKCTYESLEGSFKLVYSSDGKATILFDSDKNKSGDIVTVTFPKGSGLIRLVGKPATVEKLTVTWEDIDRSKLHLTGCGD
jgi:hypothetical protein